MYLKSSSEPPEPLDGNKNGLRGGFPIKINGYALGSQESLQDFGTQDGGIVNDRGSIFGPRVRSRQNSMSRQNSVSRQSSVARNFESSETNNQQNVDMFCTPFGPAQGQAKGPGQGLKMKGKICNTSTSKVTNNKSDENKSSSLLNLSLLSDASATETTLSNDASGHGMTSDSMSNFMYQQMSTQSQENSSQYSQSHHDIRENIYMQKSNKNFVENNISTDFSQSMINTHVTKAVQNSQATR